MLAVRFDRTVALADIPLPAAAAGEALVRTRLAGICATDIEITKGYMGFQGTLGHEFVGEVVAGSEPDRIGQRGVGDINLSCGGCAECAGGLDQHCPHRAVLGIQNKEGAFAEYLTLPLANLHPIPAGVTDRCAVFAEPLAAALRILDQVEIGPGRRVLLVGDGKLGLLVAHVLRTTGCDLRAVGKHPHKLAQMASLGVTTHVLSDYRPDRHDVVVEASGSPLGLDLAIGSLRPRGTLVLKSTFANTAIWDPSALVVNEITVLGSRCGRVEAALRFLAEREPPVQDLIEATYPLGEAAEALAHASRPGALKVLLDPLA
jgi:threonine dehydrogenase-like Zn-dependent dehydrogenase